MLTVFFSIYMRNIDMKIIYVVHAKVSIIGILVAIDYIYII